jgi:PAS domain S-box-containing protein
MQKTNPHPLARINYAIRAGSFAYSFVVVGIHGWERDYGATFWAGLVTLFLVYPHLAYLHARFAADPRAAEKINLYVDAALLGACIGALHFPLWLAFAALFSTTLNAAVVLGLGRGGSWSVAVFSLGAAIGMAATGFRFEAATSNVVTAMCFIGSFSYNIAVGSVVHMLRNRVRESEARYRLLAENAADLVAMVDQRARWIYASPSFGSLFNAADLAAGGDAFAHAQPEDATRARDTVRRSAASGESRELQLRLTDRAGRLRQYKGRVQPVKGEDLPALRLVLALRDVTDLRESEEQLLISASALEGITEAIMITGADGTVRTVNGAFTAVTGYTREEVLGRPETEIRSALQPASFYDEIYAAVERDGHWSGTTWSRRKNGSVYREWRSVRVERDGKGDVTHYVIVFYELDTSRDVRKSGVGAGF